MSLSATCAATATDVDVVIVGAGFAGLSAAHELEQRGVTYALLEGQAQVGGRVRSKKDVLLRPDDGSGDGVTVEDGANWILGGDDNPIFELATEYGLKVVRCDFNDTKTYFENGTEVPKSLEEASQKMFDDAKRCLFDYAKAFSHPHSNLEDSGSRDIIRRCGWIPGNEIDYVVEWMGLDFAAASPDQVSLQSLPDDSFLDFSPDRPLGDWHFVTDDRGYGYLVTRLAEELNTTEPRLGSNVSSIHWDYVDKDLHSGSGDYSVVVKGQNWLDGTPFEVRSKKVISTVSVGVLSRRPDMFEPKMPRAKVDANVFEMSVFEKVFFRFPKKFWGEEEVIRVAVSKEKQGKCNVWYNLAKKSFKPNSNVLFCMITGEIAEKIGAFQNKQFLLNETLLDSFLQPLRNIYKDDYVDPIAHYFPGWPNDEWEYGALEQWKIGRSFEDFEYFSDPLVNSRGEKVVYFSGSATCTRYAGWVHGAFLAGQRSALQVAHDLGIPDIEVESDCDWEDAYDDETESYFSFNYTAPWNDEVQSK